MYVVVGTLNLWNLFCVLIAKLPYTCTGCQLVGKLFEAHKQVLNKSTSLIALKFGYEVLLEMATECFKVLRIV